MERGTLLFCCEVFDAKLSELARSGDAILRGGCSENGDVFIPPPMGRKLPPGAAFPIEDSRAVV